MPTVEVYNSQNEEVGKVALDDTVFGCEVKEHLLYAAVRYQRAKARAGTHKVKERAEVSGGGRKPWRQKGTGRARQGSIRSPHWRGGGVVFGPRYRSHAFKLNKKVRRAALRSALSRRVEEGAVSILDAVTLEAPRTREFVSLMARFGWKDLLLVVPERDDAVDRSSRNIPNVTVVPVGGVNVYDVLRRSHLVMTVGAAEALAARLGG
jgi:large subunit ribosomal protein L4